METTDLSKVLIERFDKDVKGSLTALLIIGIIVKHKRIWTYQIKKTLKTITNSEDNISNSSLYSLLGRLEKDYHLIYSEKDKEVQRRFYMATEKCETEFNRVKAYWIELMNLADYAIKKLEED